MRDLSFLLRLHAFPPLARFSRTPRKPYLPLEVRYLIRPSEEVFLYLSNNSIFPCLELGKESLRSFPLPETSPYCSNFCLCPQKASIHTLRMTTSSSGCFAAVD